MSSIRIVVVDDDECFREALRFGLDQEEGFEVVGEAADGYTAIEMTRRLRPHVVVTDIDHPGPSGYAVTEAIAGVDGVKVLVFSGYAGTSEVQRSWQAGAMGFVVKGESMSVLTSAIKTVAGGGEFLSPGLSLVDPPTRATPPAARRPTPDW
jgi:DNA-binding NarL/FixJ family response regulator